MVADTQTVKCGDKDVVCYDLTYGFLLDIGSGVIEESKHAVVMDGTDLSEDDIRALRGSHVDELYNTITRLTYPQMYNEDGSMKEIEVNEDDKKKV